MATPFSHAHVIHVSKARRRRSRSLTIQNFDEEDNPEQNIQRKQFFAQLQKEQQKNQKKNNEQHQEQSEKQQDGRYNPNVSRVARTGNTGEYQEQSEKQQDGRYNPNVSRVGRTENTASMNKNVSSTRPVAGASKKDITSISSGITYSDENEDEDEDEDEDDNGNGNYHEYQPSVMRIAQLDSETSLRRKIPNKTGKSSNTNVAIAGKSFNTSVATTGKNSNTNTAVTGKSTNTNAAVTGKSVNTNPAATGKNSNSNGTKVGKNPKLDSFTTLNGAHGDLSQISSYPLLASSINATSKSEICDQNFDLDDPSDHARRNDAKQQGRIIISGPGKYYTTADRKLASISSTSFMTAIIAVVIGIIAFAFGLTALVLVLLLRSTVNAELANSTNSSTATTNYGTWTAVCSSYTTINDPTRSVNAPGYALGCDNTAPFFNNSTPTWIRFVGTGGTMLPLTTPGLNICGSMGTGWYYGTMPSSGQIVNGTACFTWTNAICEFSASISVANCGSFYIYLLPPVPACMIRYCTI